MAGPIAVTPLHPYVGPRVGLAAMMDEPTSRPVFHAFLKHEGVDV